jgi:ATP-dependent Lhr-like helicase
MSTARQLSPSAALEGFHPVVREWFERTLGEPSAPQVEGWPEIRKGVDVLIAAPTGSGKTLAAFLACLDWLFRQAVAGTLPDETEVLYVSPLKALGNDVQKNLLQPLEQIFELARAKGLDPQPIRVQVRTGDTAMKDRAAMVRRPPHILITTPESLFLYLTAAKSRETLRAVRTVIVDEIHALARDKRGSHFALSMARLEALLEQRREEERAISIPAAAAERVISSPAVVVPRATPIAALSRAPFPPKGERELPRLVRSAKEKRSGTKKEVPSAEKSNGDSSLSPFGGQGARDSAAIGVARSTTTAGEAITRRESPLRLQRIGLSATQKPLEMIAGFLVGPDRPCHLVKIGHQRPWDLKIETPEDELSAVATHEMWGQVYDRIVQLVSENRTTLIFVNTRKLAERVAHDLGERMGKDAVAAHHGSLAREIRLNAETRLKSGQLKAMVATASLELGLDIGSVDLVCQIGTPRSISVFLQRVGRAGHYKGGISKGVIFALTRDELVECASLVRAVREGTLDAVRMPEKPLDVLSQQIVGACAADDWKEDDLFALAKRAYPYRDLERADFDQVVHMLSEGVATARGRGRAHLHRDRVNGVLRARRGARLTALLNSGAIPDTFQYQVIALPENKSVGTLDEDFAIESTAGDIFALGSTSWRVRRVTNGKVLVEDAAGQPPSMPFWVAEAPSRTPELSLEVARLRGEIVHRPDAQQFLHTELGLSDSATELVLRYGHRIEEMLGGMPSQELVIAERFFDDAGGMQLIIHAPFGGRINRAWGLALRKRFCRSFDFELQAAADDDGILLSLGEQHSFPLIDILDFLSPNNVEEVLRQAILQTPQFGTRFRWNATRALALERFTSKGRVPPALQRARSEDLLAAVFPAQVMCQDNMGGGDIELPDHPLTKSAMHDCLRDAMDVDGLKLVLEGLKSGRIQKRAVDLPEPSPLAHHLLNAMPYTFLDDAPLEERRARAISVRHTLPKDAVAYGALDKAAIAQVIAEAQPPVRDEHELHEALLQLGLASDTEVDAALLNRLIATNRAARLFRPGRVDVFAAERLPLVQALEPAARIEPKLLPFPGDGPLTRDDAIVALVRGHLEICGPTTAAELATRLGLQASETETALLKLEGEGQAMRGHFREGIVGDWCDRRLLQRIHRLTVGKLRKEIEPLSPADFMRFLFKRHHLEKGDELRGKGGVVTAISLLEGYEAPASSWETGLLPSRVKGYEPELLDKACREGEVAWGRLSLRDPPPVSGPSRGASGAEPRTRVAGPNRNASVSFVRREQLGFLLASARGDAPALPDDLSPQARAIADTLKTHGALFFSELIDLSGKLASEVEESLWELVARGVATADDVGNLRILQSPAERKRRKAERRGGPGRWSLLRSAPQPERQAELERLARLFLDRYGIVWRDLAIREPLAPPWRELLPVYRRLEARGEVRGGRFVGGFAGEQFASLEAVESARAVRRIAPAEQQVRIAAVDPLNLTGVVTPGARIPATPGKYVVYVDGVPHEDESPRTISDAKPGLRIPRAPPRHPYAAPGRRA